MTSGKFIPSKRPTDIVVNKNDRGQNEISTNHDACIYSVHPTIHIILINHVSLVPAGYINVTINRSPGLESTIRDGLELLLSGILLTKSYKFGKSITCWGSH